jgi:hypothetical protein
MVRQTLIGFAALIVLASCNQEPDTRNATGNVQVRIPFPDEGGGYSLKVIGLSGITSLYEFAGKYANFYVSPAVDRSNRIHGTRPKGHFLKTAKNIYVPLDTEISQQMAVIYAHLERLSLLDNELGVGDLQQGPRDVGLMVRYSSPGKGGLTTNNAYYNPETDSILLVPYTESELPIAVNGGILAHEHFHSLYYKLVGRKIGQKAQGHGQELLAQVQGAKVTRTTLEGLRDESLSLAERTNLFSYLGMNEGLADFWAWVYTGDPDFLASSVSSESARRSMKMEEAAVKELAFSPVRRWRNVVGELGGERCSIYCLGTEYAKALKAYSNVVETTRGISSVQARRLVAKAIVTALPSLAVSLKELKKDEYFEPVSFLALVEVAMGEERPEEKSFLKGILTRTLGEDALPIVSTSAGMRP